MWVVVSAVQASIHWKQQIKEGCDACRAFPDTHILALTLVYVFDFTILPASCYHVPVVHDSFQYLIQHESYSFF